MSSPLLDRDALTAAFTICRCSNSGEFGIHSTGSIRRSVTRAELTYIRIPARAFQGQPPTPEIRPADEMPQSETDDFAPRVRSEDAHGFLDRLVVDDDVGPHVHRGR